MCYLLMGLTALVFSGCAGYTEWFACERYATQYHGYGSMGAVAAGPALTALSDPAGSQAIQDCRRRLLGAAR